MNINEKFYKNICEKYIKIKTNDMLLEENNKILYVFREDNDTYYDYLHGRCEVHEYSCYKNLFDRKIKNEIAYDLNDLELFNEKGEWDFYISFEELKGIGYGYIVKYNYPLIEKYIIDDETDFYDYFSLEQLKDFEESLHLYYETDDIDTNKWGELYSKSNTPFNHNIISLSEGMIDYNDFISDYIVTSYDLLLDNVIAYFRENQIKNLMDYGSDGDEGLTPISSLYKEMMDKLSIKYDDVYTEDVSDGKYLTTITFDNNSKIKVDTSAWNGIKVVANNVKSIYENFKNLSLNLTKNQNKNDMEYEY